jgi:hypothetical protein
VSEQTDNNFDIMLFYERTVAGKEYVVEEDVQEGDGPAATSDTPDKAISNFSGTEESSDEQGSAHEEDSDDDEEASDEEGDSEKDTSRDEEELHIDYGYGPDDAEFLAAEGRRYLESRDEENSDDEFDDDELDSEFSVDTDDLDPEYVFGELHPEAKAQEFAAVYQKVAEHITGDAKETLLDNAQQVLVVGLMLAKSLRKQEQADDCKTSARSSDEEMPGQPTPEDQTSGPGNMLQTFKSMTAHAKGICLAQGAGNASLLLEEVSHNLDNFEIIRKLHLYTARAIMLCKQLHDIYNPPQDDNPTLFEKMPSLRGRVRGLRLASCYRGFGKLLLNMKNTDNMSEICNMYLCASYVTEMGWQLDDLQVESFRHAYICAALKARNDTLAIQNETLETLKEVRERQKNTLETQRKILQAQKNTLKS